MKTIFKICCLLSYAVGIIWIFLFPAINISSGELKPRSFYVDEHAFVINTARFPNLAHDHELLHEIGKLTPSSTKTECSGFTECNNICGHFESFSFINCSQVATLDGKPAVTILPLNGLYQKMFMESIDIVIRIPECGMSDAVSLATRIAFLTSKVRWLSKAVTIILLPEFQSQDSNIPFSSVLESLKFGSVLMHRQQLSGNDLFIASLQQSNTRSALIVDLTTQCSNNSSYAVSINDVTDSSSRWSHVDVSFVGANGALPNMDVVSSLLAMFDTEMVVHIEKPVVDNRVVMDGLGPCQYTHVCRLLLRAFVSSDITASVFGWSPSTVNEYFYRLDSLLANLWNGAWMPSSGLHAQYLRRNIDAVTLIPQPHRAPVPSGSKRQQQQRAARQQHPDPIIGVSDLASMVMSFIKLHSNLHEKLHHSLFLYVAMGSRHFVGINEYGLVILCLLLPLLGLAHILMEAIKENQGSTAEEQQHQLASTENNESSKEENLAAKSCKEPRHQSYDNRAVVSSMTSWALDVSLICICVSQTMIAGGMACLSRGAWLMLIFHILHDFVAPPSEPMKISIAIYGFCTVCLMSAVLVAVCTSYFPLGLWLAVACLPCVAILTTITSCLPVHKTRKPPSIAARAASTILCGSMAAAAVCVMSDGCCDLVACQWFIDFNQMLSATQQMGLVSLPLFRGLLAILLLWSARIASGIRRLAKDTEIGN